MSNDYNKFTQLPLMQYKIIAYLMQNDENIWKVLQHSEPNALSQPNLSQSDKAKLIYQGQPISSGFRVFMDSFMDDSFIDQASIIRIFPEIIIPKNRIVADITFRIECFSHVKTQYLDGYMNRNVYLMQQIISTLNGVDILGVGLLSFDRMGSPYDKAVLNISNNRQFTGYSIFMSTHTT